MYGGLKRKLKRKKFENAIFPKHSPINKMEPLAATSVRSREKFARTILNSLGDDIDESGWTKNTIFAVFGIRSPDSPSWHVPCS